MSGTLEQHKLAVVIPAFKPDYFAKTLACLARQTDQRFSLYICDDASPADIQGIARSVLGTRPYVYRRFENNLGGVSLAKHWDRCVALSTEPWVWLFSDDDLMDDNCVEAFHKFLEAEGESADLLRFEGWIIDGNDRLIGPQSFDLDRESWLEFAYGYLMDWRYSFMQKLVFRRTALDRAGGFLDLPLCWKTDDAAVIALARHKVIRRIYGARVLWRSSQHNISPDRSVRTRIKKLRAACLLLHWLQDQIKGPREHLFEDDNTAFHSAMDRFLVGNIELEGAIPTLANWRLISQTRASIGHGSRLALLKYVMVAAVNDGLSFVGGTAKKLAGRAGK